MTKSLPLTWEVRETCSSVLMEGELATAGITNVVNSFAGVQDPIIMLFDWKSGQEKTRLKPDKTFQGIAWGVRYHPDGFLIGRRGQPEW